MVFPVLKYVYSLTSNTCKTNIKAMERFKKLSVKNDFNVQLKLKNKKISVFKYIYSYFNLF